MKKTLLLLILLLLLPTLAFSQDETPEKGTRENPYTVAEFQQLTMDNNNKIANVWVQGYIVGSSSGTSLSDNNAKFTSEGAVESNILLSDNKEEDSYLNCIAIALPSETSTNKIRAELNVKTNPTNFGRGIAICGTGTKYFGQNGINPINNNEKYYFLDDLTPVTITFNPSFIEVNQDEAFTFIEPEVSVPEAKEFLQYSIISDASNIATIDNNIIVFDTSKLGTVVIEAGLIKNDSYFAASAQFTLIVIDPDAQPELFDLVTDISEIDDDSDYIIVNEYYKKALSTVQRTNNRGVVDIIFNEHGQVEYNEGVQIINFELLENDTYHLIVKSETEEIGYLGAQTENKLLTTSDPFTNYSNAKITISSEGTYIKFIENETEYDLRFLNWSGGLFSCYTTNASSSNYAIKIYKRSLLKPTLNFMMDDKIVNNQVVELKWNATEAPVLVYPEGLDITYNSSNPEVAEISSDGKLTLHHVEGTTVISAKSEAVEDEFIEGYAEFTLKVANPSIKYYTFNFIDNTYKMSRYNEDDSQTYNEDNAELANEDGVKIINHKNGSFGTRLHTNGLRFYTGSPSIELPSEDVKVLSVNVTPENKFRVENDGKGNWFIYCTDESNSPQNYPLTGIDVSYIPYAKVTWTHEATSEEVRGSHTGTHRIAHRYVLTSQDSENVPHDKFGVMVSKVNSSEIAAVAEDMVAGTHYTVETNKYGVTVSLLNAGTYALTPTLDENVVGYVAKDEPLAVEIEPLTISVGEFEDVEWSADIATTGNTFKDILSYDAKAGALNDMGITVSVTPEFKKVTQPESWSADCGLPYWLWNQMTSIQATEGNVVDGYYEEPTVTPVLSEFSQNDNGQMEASIESVQFPCSGVYSINLALTGANSANYQIVYNSGLENANLISIYPCLTNTYSYTLAELPKQETDNGTSETAEGDDTTTKPDNVFENDGLTINGVEIKGSGTDYSLIYPKLQNGELKDQNNLDKASIIIPGLYLETLYYNQAELTQGMETTKKTVAPDGYTAVTNWQINLSKLASENNTNLVLKLMAEKNGAITPSALQIAISPDTQVTGVESVTGETDSAEPVFYNLQGVKVKNPGPGIYIKVSGNKSEKVVIR